MDEFTFTEFDPTMHPTTCACCMSWGDPYLIVDPYSDPFIDADPLWTDVVPLGDPLAAYPSAPETGIIDLSRVGAFETGTPVQSEPIAVEANVAETFAPVEAPTLPLNTGYLEVMPSLETPVAVPLNTGYLEVMPSLETPVAVPLNTGTIQLVPPLSPGAEVSGQNTGTIVVGSPTVPTLDQPMPDWADDFYQNKLVNANPVDVDVNHLQQANNFLPLMFSRTYMR